MKLYKIMKYHKIIYYFFLQATEVFLKQSNIYGGAFLRKEVNS